MIRRPFSKLALQAGLVILASLWSTGQVWAQQRPDPIVAPQSNPNLVANDATLTTAPDSANSALNSTEQGRIALPESFDYNRQWRVQKRINALEDTQFKIQLRTYYFSRDKFDNSQSEAMAIGGWMGFKTGYFMDHVAFGITGYTSQRLLGDKTKDGTLLLKPGQEGYTVLGEAYADIRFDDDNHLYVGRKEYDTPYINRNDTRMTPNTFEAIVFQGQTKWSDNESLKYGAGYFFRIKDRNSDQFVWMSDDAGASIHRGVFTAGALYKRGDYSIGAIDYYSPDIINIAYSEAKAAFPISGDFKPTLAVQFTDQRSTGSDALQGEPFSAQQAGIKADIPWGRALFTAGYTKNFGDTNLQLPWGGYPGYTSVQVEDFNRAGEGAFILRAGYDFSFLKGLSAYSLWVHGTDPKEAGQFRKDEVDFNVQWAPTEGFMKGFALRVRYGLVDQHGGGADTASDFRVIANYSFSF